MIEYVYTNKGEETVEHSYTGKRSVPLSQTEALDDLRNFVYALGYDDEGSDVQARSIVNELPAIVASLLFESAHTLRRERY